MMYTICVDLIEAIEDVYPGLSISEVELIAKEIHQCWDYSSIYDEVLEQVEEIANKEGIELDGKDGIPSDKCSEVYDDITDPYGGY